MTSEPPSEAGSPQRANKYPFPRQTSTSAGAPGAITAAQTFEEEDGEYADPAAQGAPRVELLHALCPAAFAAAN